jgi:hypothetical protein
MPLYERKSEYWAKDLQDREFEQAVMAGLDALGWEYQDNTQAFERPDLYLYRNVRGKRVRVALELKDKRQPFRARWAELAGVAEGDLLVLDEVAARKLLAHGVRALVLFWDRTRPDRPYVVYNMMDLFCLPKRRVLRRISHQAERLKAKWLLDARHGHAFNDLKGVFAYVANYIAHGIQADLRRLEAHGPFTDERVETL